VRRDLREIRTRWFLLAFAALGAVLYAPTFRWLFSVWMEDKEYSHGILIPFVALYVAVIRRKSVPPPPDAFSPRPPAGGALLLAAAALLWAGHSGGFVLSEGLSLLVFIPGVILLLYGYDALRLYAFPLAYLQFMVPWMEEILNFLKWPFQILSANMGIRLLEMIDVPAYIKVNYIYLPNVVLEVAQGCSGIQYMLSVIALGLPLVYLTQSSWFKGGIVLLIGILITILANGFRIAMGGFLAFHYGGGMVHGPFHIFQGWFVAQVGLVFLFLVNYLVSRRDGGSRRLVDRVPAWGNGSAPSPAPLRAVAVLLAAFALSGWAIRFHSEPRAYPARGTLSEIPYSISGMTGREAPWIDGSEYFPGVDNVVARVYSAPGRDDVYLLVAYDSLQRQGKSLVGYRARPLVAKSRPVPLPSGGDAFRASSPRIGGADYYALYWYQSPEGTTTGRFRTKMKTILDGMVKRENPGVFVMAAKRSRDPIPPGLADLAGFAGAVRGELERGFFSPAGRR
jgi:exosortase